MSARPLIGYLAPEGREKELQAELDQVVEVHGRLVLAAGALQKAAWCENIWLKPQKIQLESIGLMASHLKAIQRNWSLLPHTLHRRAELIVEKLPKIQFRDLSFPAPLPTAPLGSWTLLEKNQMLYSAECTNPFPNGLLRFKAPEQEPPSSAYLKLWEALTLAGSWPQPGEHCLDMGSCPGSWTWALQQLGAKVTSVDRAPLEGSVLDLPRVDFLKRDAFGLDCEEVKDLDWFFCDVICYPERLLELVHKWMSFKRSLRFVCTIKFKGSCDLDVLRAFKKIPHSSVRHLFHNKNELTWMKL